MHKFLLYEEYFYSIINRTNKEKQHESLLSVQIISMQITINTNYIYYYK